MLIIVATGLNTGTAEYKNMGDVAMLQVAVARLQALCPDARIFVITDSPADLTRSCPGAIPVSRKALQYWTQDRTLLGPYHRFLPGWASARLSLLKRTIRRNWPSLLKSLMEFKFRLRDPKARGESFRASLDAFSRANVLVVCGSGGFADSCRDWNLSTLNTIEAAVQSGVPVVMLGQGFGPLTDPVVLKRAAQVLPAVELIGSRGTRDALRLLQALGVASGKVRCTGDDAVELAYSARAAQPGNAIGVNLRIANYAGSDTGVIEKVKPALHQFARRKCTTLVPLPIALHDYADDSSAIRQLLAGFDDKTDGGRSFETPLDVIGQVSRCRIVVTGAYHAAVFALAQGIPVVCCVNSPYYLAKFQGLQDLFGAGCEIVADCSRDLAEAIANSWNSADQVRPHLLEAALRQIESGRRAYQGVPLLGSDPPASHSKSLVESGAR